MKAKEKFLAMAGGNIDESIDVDRPEPAARQSPSGARGRMRGLTAARGAFMIPVDALRPDPGQPRREFDPEPLERLAASLKARGQLQPIRVRWSEADQVWYVVAGERRWRAAGIAGLPSLSCVDAGHQTPEDVRADQLTENCLREDLKPIEEARAFRALMEHHGWTQRELADFLHVSTAKVSMAFRALDLPGDLQEAVDAGAVGIKAAVDVARTPDPAEREAKAARLLASAASGARARTRSRFGFTVDGGTVTVELRKPDATRAEARSALRAALRQADDAKGSAA